MSSTSLKRKLTTSFLKGKYIFAKSSFQRNDTRNEPPKSDPLSGGRSRQKECLQGNDVGSLTPLPSVQLILKIHYIILTKNSEVVSFSSSPIMTKNINFISTWVHFLNQIHGSQLVSNCDMILYTRLQYHFKRL